jgi:hypothetical protein
LQRQLLCNIFWESHVDLEIFRSKPESNRSEEQKLLFGAASDVETFAVISRFIANRIAVFFKRIRGEAIKQGRMCHALVQNWVSALPINLFDNLVNSVAGLTSCTFLTP